MTIHTSPHPAISIPEQPITDFVLRHAERLADKAAYIDGPSGRVMTFGALRTSIDAVAAGLAAEGVGKGTIVALMAPNSPEYAVVFHAVASTGASVTTLNPTYKAEELAFQLKDSGATWMVTVGLFAELAGDACDQAGVAHRVVIGEATDGWRALSSLHATPGTETVSISPHEDIVALPYSSGTTGFPKGVMLSHHNLVSNLRQCESVIQVREDEVIFAVLPFFHIYGMTVLMNYMIARGATVITAPRFDLEQMLELTQTHRITRLFLVPPIVLALAKHPIVEKYDLSTVHQIFSGAAPLSAELAEAAAARVGCEVVQGYGMTELSPVSHAIVDGQYRAGSSGTLLPNTEARLVDPATEQDAEEGELWVRGPQVMLGYLNNPEATAATIDDDGWLHTGDIARVDADGHVYIVDRVKELIKVKAFQVPPAELEALLLQHPAVADAAVIGLPDDESGEVPLAFVVIAPGASTDEATLQAFVAEHVATYKQIKHVRFVEQIPKSASGKILRRELRGMVG
ncbi:MAG: AMP-binding protein [Acidobacteriota bacterium]